MCNNIVIKPRKLPNRAKQIRALGVGESYYEPEDFLRNNYAICATTASYLKKQAPDTDYQTEKRPNGIYVHRIK